MKIFVIENLLDSSGPRYRLIPDSSLVTRGKPVFLPDQYANYTATPAIVIRIDRLGKAIAPKFAERYYSETAIGMILKGIALPNDCSEISRLGALDFDGAAVCADFTPTQFDSAEIKTTITNPDSSSEIGTALLTNFRSLAQRLISDLSQTKTLKTGDLIFICSDSQKLPIEQGSAVDATFTSIPNALHLHFNLR